MPFLFCQEFTPTDITHDIRQILIIKLFRLQVQMNYVTVMISLVMEAFTRTPFLWLSTHELCFHPFPFIKTDYKIVGDAL